MSDSETSVASVAPPKDKKAQVKDRCSLRETPKKSLLGELREKRLALEQTKKDKQKKPEKNDKKPEKKTPASTQPQLREKHEPPPETASERTEGSYADAEEEPEVVVIKKAPQRKKVVYVEESESEEEEVVVKRKSKDKPKKDNPPVPKQPKKADPPAPKQPKKDKADPPALKQQLTGYNLIDQLLFSKR